MTPNALAILAPFRSPGTVAALMLGTALVVTQVLPLGAQETAPDAPAENPVAGDSVAADGDQALTPEEPALTPEANRPLTFADLAAQVSPAVVNITTSMTVAGNAGPEGLVPEGSPFEDFFNDMEEGAPRRSSALGSGFVISDDGYIVTNNHVIEGADEIIIDFFDDREDLPATVIGTDPTTDIALLKVEAEGMPFVEFGDSNGPGARVGDWVMAMGNPLGQSFSVSAGIVSARERALTGTYDDYIQTDAAINRGNSGGPLFNMQGEVIGVNSAILSPTGGSIGIGFAQSATVVENVVDQLREFGETRRGWLGVRIQPVTPELAEGIEGLEEPVGALVTDVPEGPALDAGMEAGDVILTFNGQDVPNERELVRMVAAAPVGEPAIMEILRDGETLELSVVLARREEAEAAALPASAEGGPEAAPAEVLGLTLSQPTDELREQFGLDEAVEGLVVTEVDPLSDAGEKGFLPGDVITEAGQKPVATVEDLQAAVTEAEEAGRKSLLMLMRRGGDPRFVALSLEN